MYFCSACIAGVYCTSMKEMEKPETVKVEFGKVKIELKNGMKIKGYDAYIFTDSLEADNIYIPKKTRNPIPLSQLESLSYSNYNANKIGFVLGAITAVKYSVDSEDGYAIIFAPVVAVVGGWVGYVIGSYIYMFWRNYPLTRYRGRVLSPNVYFEPKSQAIELKWSIPLNRAKQP